MFMKVAVTFLAILLLTMASVVAAEEQTMMTRNLYLGAEIQSLAEAEDPADFFARVQEALVQIAANNFPARAEALATEIIERKPHLIGLQEVYNFTFNGSNGLPPFRDHLEDLLGALAAQGASYYVAATVNNLDITIPFPSFGLIGIADRDVILARDDVETTPVDLTPFCSKPSEDGCNYNVIAIADTPVGPINIERGFVVVDALIGDLLVRLSNTHLEVRYVDPTNPASPAIQAYQAAELISILDLLPNPQSAPVIMVGDINSSPEDLVIDLGPMLIVPPYMQLEAEGNVDVWTLRPGNPKGFTCCQEEDLLNPESILYERIDVIFSSEEPEQVKANVVGNDDEDRLPSGLWPSDHVGVVAEMELAP
jgi:endonuclease/exonuclease/phosphatase family metal-dependent hydrolase